MTVHNSAGVKQLESMGFQRAVLARELTIEELAHITAHTSLELEIFVHGALCFSYSGLCLASSFHGGRSSLRGRCVQPCRRLYRAGRHQGYFFSTNDLSAIELIPRLRLLRLAAFKIEGRMKPAAYVATTVRAYRLVLDASPGDEDEAVTEAKRLLQKAYGRKPTRGFFVASEHKEIISPHRSGASGRLAAKVEWVRGSRMGLRLRCPLEVGDRLRLESDEEMQKSAFTVKEMVVRGRRRTTASTGTVVNVSRIHDARRGDRLFKTSFKLTEKSSPAGLLNLLKEKTSRPPVVDSGKHTSRKILTRPKTREANNQPFRFYLRLSQLNLLKFAFDCDVRGIFLQATRTNLHAFSKRKMSPGKRKRFFWALPEIIPEKDLNFYEDQIHRLQKMGYGQWLVANWGHFQLFSEPAQSIIADYTFNVLNSQASGLLGEMGCRLVIVSLESDRNNLLKLTPAIQGLTPLLTVFGWPPLFTSRLEVKPRLGSIIKGAGRDTLEHGRQLGQTVIRSGKPLCLFEHLQEIGTLGIKNYVVDLRGKQLRRHEFHAVMKRIEHQRCPKPHSTFNYLGKLD
jgi:putative protease